MTQDPSNLKALAEEISAITDEVETYLSRFGPAVASLASTLRQTDSPSALRDVGQLAEGLEWLLGIANDLAQASAVGQIHKAALLAFTRGIESFLYEFNGAMERGDRTMRADLLEFELTPLLYDLGEVLSNLRGLGDRTNGEEVH